MVMMSVCYLVGICFTLFALLHAIWGIILLALYVDVDIYLTILQHYPSRRIKLVT
jgi:hypothetical protein